MDYPKDRFDDLPGNLDRRGAHRAPRTRGARIASWLWGLGAIALLVVLGLVGMSMIDGVVSRKSDVAVATAPSATPAAPAAPTPTPTQVAPKLDPEVAVSVYNGSGKNGVATKFSKKLKSAGWKIDDVGTSSDAAQDATVVAYAKAEQEAAARQVLQDLGGGSMKLDATAASNGGIVVVIGKDIASS